MTFPVSHADIVDGLRSLGLEGGSRVVVHSSLRSFGRVEEGAETVCRALLDTCGTVMMPAFTFDATGIDGAPPGHDRPLNAFFNAPDWETFDAAVRAVSPLTPDTPVDEDIGAIPESFRQLPGVGRSRHPLMSWVATGDHGESLLRAQTLADPLAPLQQLADLDGDVLLLGVGHWASTIVHLAEQRCGRSRFWRFAVIEEGIWAELPNIPGDSSAFGRLDDVLEPETEAAIGACRARRYRSREILRVVESLIEADPAALLDLHHPGDERTEAAYRQRLAWLDARRR